MGTITPLERRARPGIVAPAPLTVDHQLSDFRCGKQALDDWLRHKALKSEGRTARTYVVCLDRQVVGYYCFASGAVRRDEMPKGFRHNTPEVVPVTILGRLAVDERFQGMKIGKNMLKEGLSRALQASTIVGSRAVLVHAIDEDAVGFYTHYGFIKYPEGSQTLFLPIETIEQVLR